MNAIRTILIGEAIQEGRAEAKRKYKRAASPEPERRDVSNEKNFDGSAEKLGESPSSSSRTKAGEDDQDNEMPEENEEDMDARLEAYEEEFERPGEPPIKWWFAAKGIPLIAATVGPLANLTSVAALVSPWRSTVPLDGEFAYDERYETTFPDPRWAIGINAASLVFGVIGNFFLMCNYSQRIRYVIAMPLTIGCWYIAFGLLSGVLGAMHIYARPVSPEEIYTQAYWFGIISAGLYVFAASILFVNIFGVMQKHYPVNIESSRSEKNLMLQTIFFFAWLGIGALMFAKVEGWSYSDAVYFCNVTLLTVGFGDIAAKSDTARGLVFPFSVIGIIMLGLVVNSIHGFVIEIGEKQVVEQHITARRKDVANRAISTSSELHRDDPTLAEFRAHHSHPTVGSLVTSASNPPGATHLTPPSRGISFPKQILNTLTPGKRRSRPILLRASRDRFHAMRRIQRSTLKFKKWTAFATSSAAFITLWLIGAVIFMIAEKETQGLTYFQSLYFCYVSLLTIGYGDLSPRSNAGKAFFLLWSIWSVPTITILISSMGSTIIENFQNYTLKFAEFTILPKEGIRKQVKENYGAMKEAMRHMKDKDKHGRPGSGYSAASRSSSSDNNGRDIKPESGRRGESRNGAVGGQKRVGTLEDISETSRGKQPQIEGFDDRDEEEGDLTPLEEPKPLPQDFTFQQLLKALTEEIRNVGRQVATDPKREYEYEEWVEFTRLIRACEVVKPYRLKGLRPGEEIPREQIDDEEGFVLWDWIGEQSPLLYEGREPAWVQDRLTKGLEELVARHMQSISLNVPS